MMQTRKQIRRIVRQSRRRTVTLIAVVISLAALSHVVLGDDQPTPSPTPLYLRPLARPGSVRRIEQLERQRTLEAESQSRAARARAREDRRATATAQAQAREAARERERAQCEVDAEARRESARATPRPTSDLMKRMGFNDQEIAAQKALEDSSKAEASPSASPAKK